MPSMWPNAFPGTGWLLHWHGPGPQMQHNFQVTDRNKRGLAEQEVHCIIKWLWWSLISGITYQKIYSIVHVCCCWIDQNMTFIQCVSYSRETGVLFIVLSSFWVPVKITGVSFLFFKKVCCCCCCCYYYYWHYWEALVGPRGICSQFHQKYST